jgi:hypothetical protein
MEMRNDWKMAAGLPIVVGALLVLTLSVSFGLASGNDGADQYEVTVRFNTSATQDDIDEAGALLRSYDEDIEFLTTRCYPPMGTAMVTTDAPDSVEAELKAKIYVDDVSFRPWDESNQGASGIATDTQAPARCA